MADILLGSNVNDGSSVTTFTAALTPRAWQFTALLSGVTGKLWFIPNTTQQLRFCLYTDDGVNNRPNTLLWESGTVTPTTIGVAQSVDMSAINITSTTKYHIGAKVASGTAFTKATTGSLQRCTSTADASLATAFDSTWVHSTSGTNTIVPALWIESGAVTIQNIDRLVAGSTSTITLPSSATTVSAIKITDSVGQLVTVSSGISGSGTTWTFTAPTPTDNVVGLKVGTTSIVATVDSVDTVAYTSLSYSPPAGYTYTQMTSVGVNALNPAGLGVTITANDQWIYDATPDAGDGTKYDAFDADGLFYSDYTGVRTVYHWSDTDHKHRAVIITTSGGVIVSAVGLTTAGTVTSGLTTSGLTISGL